MQIFSMDNAFFRMMGRIADLIWLNILTLICSLPIFTAGAAISAMYSVEIKLVKNEEGAITRNFFSAFKENFKNATTVWFPSIFVFVILGVNAWLIGRGALDAYKKLLIPAGISIGILIIFLCMLLNYTFALLARYDNTLKATLKNAALLSLAYFPRSLCIVIIWLFPLALMTLNDGFLLVWGAYGLAFPGYFNAMIFKGIFKDD